MNGRTLRSMAVVLWQALAFCSFQQQTPSIGKAFCCSPIHRGNICLASILIHLITIQHKHKKRITDSLENFSCFEQHRQQQGNFRMMQTQERTLAIKLHVRGAKSCQPDLIRPCQHSPLEYRAGKAWHNKPILALDRLDSTIISLDHGLSATRSKHTKGTSSIIQ